MHHSQATSGLSATPPVIAPYHYRSQAMQILLPLEDGENSIVGGVSATEATRRFEAALRRGSWGCPVGVSVSVDEHLPVIESDISM
jgi:hypothetical protein